MIADLAQRRPSRCRNCAGSVDFGVIKYPLQLDVSALRWRHGSERLALLLVHCIMCSGDGGEVV